MFAKLFSWGSGASDTDLTEEEEERQMLKTWEGIIQRAANNKKGMVTHAQIAKIRQEYAPTTI